MPEHINNIDSVRQAPSVCPECDGDIVREDFQDEPDTGCVACATFRCEACDMHWVAPKPRKGDDGD